jgi:hypothetical protein
MFILFFYFYLNTKFFNVFSFSKQIFTFVPNLVFVIFVFFSQRGSQKLCKLQVPQNLDPPLVDSVRIC